ncbi:MAG: DUF1616 domain-containing protein [Thermoplasmatota archaeon]
MIGYILASLILFFIPGYTFINALFPAEDELDKELDLLYRLAYSIVMSVVFVILLSYILGNLHFIVGYGAYYKSPYIWGGLSSMSIVFFLIGWYRGAYRRISKIHPILERPSPKSRSYHTDGFDLIEDMEKLVRKQHKLKKEIKEYKKRDADEEEIVKLEEELEDTVKNLKKLEKKRVEQLEEEE